MAYFRRFWVKEFRHSENKIAKKATSIVACVVEGAGVVGDGVPVGVDENRWFGKFVEDGTDDGFHGGGEVNGSAPCSSKTLMGRRSLERFGRKLP